MSGRLLESESRVFLRASGDATLDVLETADSIFLQGADGKRYMDFHGAMDILAAALRAEALKS
jgi:hypothetical protein